MILQNVKENLKFSSGPREHLTGEDVVFPELSGDGDPVIMDFLLLTQVEGDIVAVVVVVVVVVMDFLLLTQANHTIYDYGSFGFWVAVLAGGTTMLADGYRFENHRKFAFEELFCSKRPHPILAAIRKKPPEGWTRVNVVNVNVDKYYQYC